MGAPGGTQLPERGVLSQASSVDPAVVVSSLSHVGLFVTPMDCIACQAPLSMGFSMQDCWSGWSFPSVTLPVLRLLIPGVPE